ncbi:hypothetical protein ACLK19_28420 [Escherichia coli]
MQEEAGFHCRHGVKCPLFVSGHENQAITHSITVGSRITVQGFIHATRQKEWTEQNGFACRAD